MEQQRERIVCTSTKYSGITREEFIEKITVNKNDTYALVLFILNMLNLIANSSMSCYCQKTVYEKTATKIKPFWKSGHCQLCKMMIEFADFEQFVGKNWFNLSVLGDYYDQIFKNLFQIYEDFPSATECFLGGEYDYNGINLFTGECYSVPLSESVR